VRPLSRASSLPQLECVHSGGDWSGGRPPSLASQLHNLTECIQLGIGQLGGRFREQARSHSWNACIQVGGWSAGRPPSLASQLPQLECVHSVGDWSAGSRFREQVRSHSWNACIQLGGWSAGRSPSLASQLPPFDRVHSVGDGAAGRPLSRAGSLPQGSFVVHKMLSTLDPMWERACSRRLTHWQYSSPDRKNPPPRSTGAAGFVVSGLDHTVSTFSE